MNKIKFTIILLTTLVLVSSGIAIAENILVDGFEDGNINEYSGDTGAYTIISNGAIEGDNYLTGSSSTGGNRDIVSTTGLDNYPKRGDTIRVNARSETDSEGFTVMFGSQSVGGDSYVAEISMENNELEAGLTQNTATGVNENTVPFSLPLNEWIVIEIEWGDPKINVTVYSSDSNGNPVDQLATTNFTDTTYDSGGIGFLVDSDGTGSVSVDFDNYRFETQNITDLNIDVDQHFDHSETKSYDVIATVNDSTGSITEENVNDGVTVMSNNTSLLTVDNTNNTLTADNDNSGLVTINTTYESENTSIDIFVGNATLENIHLLPSNQYIPAFIGLYDDNALAHYGPNGNIAMGSQLQLLLFSLIGGVIISDLYRNEYLGLATITILIIFWWSLGVVSMGIVYLALIYSLLAGYIQKEVPSRSDTNVGGFP